MTENPRPPRVIVNGRECLSVTPADAFLGTYFTTELSTVLSQLLRRHSSREIPYDAIQNNLKRFANGSQANAVY